jgi:hypothetical protein
MDQEYTEEIALLGHLIVAFNDLEIAMGGALTRILLRQDDELVAAVFISVLGFSQKHALLKALAVKLDDAQQRSRLLKLLEKARHLNEGRNRYIHAGYTPVTGENDEVMLVLHQRLKDFSKETLDSTDEIFKYIKPINSAELVALSNDLADLASELSILSEEFFT